MIHKGWASADIGHSLVNHPVGFERSRRSPDSFWVIFDQDGSYELERGFLPPDSPLMPHGPFPSRVKAVRYAMGLVSA